MQIVVAGASGRTGPKVVEQAVAHGHRVTAVVRHTDGQRTGYRLLVDRNATTSVHRADLAHTLVELAGNDAAVGSGYGVRRGKIGMQETLA